MNRHDEIDVPLPCEMPSGTGISHQRDHYFLRISRDVGQGPPPMLANRSNWVHRGISCAECFTTNIVGYRYFCTVCATSYCEACEQKGLPTSTRTGTHRMEHNLLKMVPPPMAQVATSAAPLSK